MAALLTLSGLAGGFKLAPTVAARYAGIYDFGTDLDFIEFADAWHLFARFGVYSRGLCFWFCPRFIAHGLGGALILMATKLVFAYC